MIYLKFMIYLKSELSWVISCLFLIFYMEYKLLFVFQIAFSIQGWEGRKGGGGYDKQFIELTPPNRHIISKL